MRNRIGAAVGFAVLLGFSVLYFGCSSTNDPIQNFFKNMTAADCTNPQQFVNNLPLVVGSPALVTAGLEQICTGLFGTVPAPTPAPGNSPVFSATPVPGK